MKQKFSLRTVILSFFLGFLMFFLPSKIKALQTGMFVEDPSFQIPVNFVYGDSNFDSGTRLADVNGDGLTDIVYGAFHANTRKVYINDGSNWVLDENWTVPIPFTGSAGSGYQYNRITDMNGDGLVDLVSEWNIFFNTGEGWVNHDGDELPMHSWEVGLKFADVNGDSLPDILYSRDRPQEDPERRVYINQGY